MNEQPQRRFSWGMCIVGFFAILFLGGLLNVGAGLLSLTLQNQPLGALIGAAPGVILILISFRTPRDGWSQGMLAAACVVALVGGMCGYGLGGGLDFK